MNETWQALSREAALAAEHLAIGVTALGRANYAEHAYYGQAFFALTIGFERATKLTMVIDHALENNGIFPPHDVLRAYGHNLKNLLEQADEIAKSRGLSAAEDRLPRTVIHTGIVKVLSDFASNITRYYNLDLVTRDPRATKRDDPIHDWFEMVILPVIDTHYHPRQKEEHQYNAQLIAKLYGDHARVLYHTEAGELLDSVYEASMQTAITNSARPYVRMYVMQIARFLGNLLSDLGYAAHHCQLETIPELSKFFAIFRNSDSSFRQRKSWSIYKP